MAYLGILGLLALASAIAFVLSRTVESAGGRATVSNLAARIRAWWVMCAVFFAVQLIGMAGSLVMFTLLSFLALREFVTIMETGRDRKSTRLNSSH